jgi:hypothetical protein
MLKIQDSFENIEFSEIERKMREKVDKLSTHPKMIARSQN